MRADAIASKAKIVVNAQGKPTEVIIPYRLYQDLIRLKISHEIYEQTDTQEEIKRAQKDTATGKTKRFTSAAEALAWLDEVMTFLSAKVINER